YSPGKEEQQRKAAALAQDANTARSARSKRALRAGCCPPRRRVGLVRFCAGGAILCRCARRSGQRLLNAHSFHSRCPGSRLCNKTTKVDISSGYSGLHLDTLALLVAALPSGSGPYWASSPVYFWPFVAKPGSKGWGRKMMLKGCLCPSQAP